MQHIEIEYNQELKPLEAVVSGVKQPGDFFVSGAIEIPMPRVRNCTMSSGIGSSSEYNS